MPSIRASAVKLDPNRWKPVSSQAGDTIAFRPNLPPAQPPHLQQSPLMLSSLPAITTSVTTGSFNQFYGGRILPRRQAILPR